VGREKREERLIALLEVLQRIAANRDPQFDINAAPTSQIDRSAFPLGEAGGRQYARAQRRAQVEWESFTKQADLLQLEKTAVDETISFLHRWYSKGEWTMTAKLIRSNLQRCPAQTKILAAVGDAQ
jgi:hypothetical protein